MSNFVNILIPVIIFVAIGAIIGLGLGFASIVMAVPINKKIAKVRNVLPGANCGVCSYSGCDGYASALVNENAKPNLCSPGGESCMQEIAIILGIENMGDVIKQTALIKCAGCSEFTSKKLLYKGIETCFAASQFYGGTWSCEYGCLGFGDCLKVCEYDAISIVNGLTRIDASLCRGCGACVDVCPKLLITIVSSKTKGIVRCSCENKGGNVRKICKVGCFACMRCTKTCQFDAITVTNNVAEINTDKCTGCGQCAKVCPAHCISIFGCFENNDNTTEKLA